MDNENGCRRFILVDDEYKFFFDHHLSGGDNSFFPPFDDDNVESETRSLGFKFSGGSKRSKLSEKKPINNRVSQKRKRKAVCSEDGVSRATPLATTRESIQRDNRASERRKRKMAEFESASVSRAVPFVNIQRDNKAKKVSESTKVNTSQDVPLVRTKEAIRRDNRIAERRKKKIDETKAAGTSRAVHVERVNKAVDKTPRVVPVTQSNKGVSVGTRKKKNEAAVDKDYASYLTWLVDSLKDSTTVPVQSEKDLLAKVKVEVDTESCSHDDDDDIMVSDSPFLSGGSTTPFVVSKSKTVIDLEKDSTEDESRNCVFTKELMEALEKPYDEGELSRLSGEVSEKKPVSRCREFRKGRVSTYETSELGPSYLENVSDFDKEYRRVDGDDKARLKLLRGFFFYLKNVTRAGSFKPWLPENQKKLGLRKQCLQTIRRNRAVLCCVVMVGVSFGEQQFIKGGIAQDLRTDGRKRLTYRDIYVETGVIPQANGSARVRIGGTDVIASVKAEIGRPSSLQPDKGKVAVFIDCSPTAEPTFGGRGGEELSSELALALQICLLGGKSGAGAGINLSSLLIKEGRVCWDLYIDGLVISSDGNLLDALGAAIKAALTNTAIPKVQVSAEVADDEQPEIDISDEEYQQFDTSSVPVIVTLTKVGNQYIVDATAEEESQMSSAVSISVNRGGHICGLTKRGGSGLDPSVILDMISVAKHVSETLMNNLDSKISAAEACEDDES
ncbi:hypothetical protein DY000_02043677 [Brassica cretica]|uniref:Ribosomal RNA-processing protein 42 n=1 Tax=Brassica cretica TaxID=69181 RepID=A0ABQ7BNB5_BRACR|nr:hypothetical protein DY000_02043677 [Brassica cretica]